VARLLVHVEGETEEAFVNEVLSGHLRSWGYAQVSARLLGNARLRDRRGGIRAWPAVRDDIVRHLREDRNCFATTMVDYYALPQNGPKAWPGRGEAALLLGPQKAPKIETALLDDVTADMGPDFNRHRFIPFIVMHEFEGLLFSDCAAFGQGVGRADLIESFQNIRNQFETPEDINDSPLTAPSKRVETLIPGYQKPFHGNLAALEIGLEKIRAACPHFRDWLTKLEALGRGNGVR
jgi:hypothetical protein